MTRFEEMKARMNEAYEAGLEMQYIAGTVPDKESLHDLLEGFEPRERPSFVLGILHEWRMTTSDWGNG